MDYQLHDREAPSRHSSWQGKDTSKPLLLEDLIVRKQESVSVEDVIDRALKLKQMLKESVTQGETSDLQKIASATQHVLQLTRHIRNLSGNFDSLIIKKAEKAAPSCSEEVGRLFFPGLVQTWEKKPVAPQEKLLAELTSRYLQTKDPDRLKELSPSEFLLTTQFLFAVHFSAQKFPDAEYFVRLSQEKAAHVKTLDSESQELETKLASIREMNAKSLQRTGRATYEGQETILSTKLEDSRARVAGLLPEVYDVSPMNAAVAMRLVVPDIVVAPVLLSELLRAHVALERLIVLVTAPQRGQETFKIYVPCIKDRRISSHQVEVTKDICEALAQDSELLAAMLRDLGELRAHSRDLISRALQHPSYTGEARETIKEFLQDPFKKVVKGHHQVLAKLIEHASPRVQIEACKLASEAVPLDTSMNRWGYALENPQNMRILEAICRAFLTSSDKDVVQAARDAMSVSHMTQSRVLSPLENVRKMIDKKQLYSVGITFDNSLQQAERRKIPLESLAILTGLHVFSANPDLCPYVKQQLPNVHLIKKLVDDVCKAHEEIEVKVRDLGRTVTKSLSHSLSDYYLDENGAELKEFIDDYMFYVKNPDALMGVSGNVGVRSAMLIYGEPGTGKTYFVECLENEVGVPCRVLSASEKEKGEDKLDYLKKVIDDVKAKKSPCILLIDEAESTVLDRTSAMASSEDRHVTNYLLQEINELRKNHPYVLIVVATNYIDRIDDAILRPGRVDIIIEMKPMSEKGRKALILRELIKEKIELDLEPRDWEELMQITEGFIPICISQAIIGTNRIYLPRIRRSNPDAIFDKELLFQKLKEEALRYGRFKHLIRDRTARD